MRLLLKKTRVVFWLGKSLYSRYAKLLISGFIIGLFLFLLGWQFAPYWQSTFFQKKEVVGIIGSYEPAKLPLEIQHLISPGLTEVASNGEIKPALASSWKSDRGGKRYFFYLKRGLFWHDGQEFTAYDINYNLKDVLINVADRYTLKIELQEPFSPLPSLLSRPLFKPGLIGLGKYEVSSIKLKENKVKRLTLKPFDKRGKSLEFRFYPNSQSAITAFKLGEINILKNASFKAKQEFAKDKHIKIEKKTLFRQFLAVFYNQKKNFFKQKEVRQALNYATPSFGQKEIYSPIPETSWAYNGKVKQYKFNLDLAKTLLKKAKVATSTNIIFSTFPEHLIAAQKIASSWKKLGLKTQVKVVHIFPSDFDVFLGIQEVPADPDQYPLWHSTQEITNITHYNNPKIDKLLEDGRKTQEREKRQKIYADFQKYLVDDAPAKFLMHPTVYTILRK